ncbi:hypothetical protein M3J09_001084 [Ascochyta lentis]
MPHQEQRCTFEEPIFSCFQSVGLTLCSQFLVTAIRRKRRCSSFRQRNSTCFTYITYLTLRTGENFQPSRYVLNKTASCFDETTSRTTALIAAKCSNTHP